MIWTFSKVFWALGLTSAFQHLNIRSVGAKEASVPAGQPTSSPSSGMSASTLMGVSGWSLAYQGVKNHLKRPVSEEEMNRLVLMGH